MASRRLDISSLLCDDPSPPQHPPVVPEPVILAPHLTHSRHPPHRRQDPPPPPFLPPYPRSPYPPTVPPTVSPSPVSQYPSVHPRPSSSSSASSHYTSPAAARLSPLLLRPSSDHAQALHPPHLPHPRHRSRSNASNPADPSSSFNPPSSSSPMSDPPPTIFRGLEALVHAATEEKRRLDADPDARSLRSPHDLHRLRHQDYALRHRIDDNAPQPDPRSSPHAGRRTSYDDEVQRIHQQQQQLQHQRLQQQMEIDLRQRKYHEEIILQERKKVLDQNVRPEQRVEQQRAEQRADQHMIQRAEQQRLEQREQQRLEQREQQRLEQMEQQRLEQREQQRLEQREQQRLEQRAEQQRLEQRAEQQRIEQQEQLRMEQQREQLRIDQQREQQRVDQQREHQLRAEQQRVAEQQRTEQLAERIRSEQQRADQRAEQQLVNQHLDQQRADHHPEHHRLEQQQRAEHQRAEHQRAEHQRAEQYRVQELLRAQEYQRALDQRHDQQQRRPAHILAQHRPTTPPPRTESSTAEHSDAFRPRKSDPGQLQPPNYIQIQLDPPQPQPPPTEHRPSKKRRYSESPTRPTIVPDDKPIPKPEPFTHSVPAEMSSPFPKRPGSGSGRRAMAVADLVSDRTPSEAPSHRILSPVGRRSPPGSLTGRAMAARKSDDTGIAPARKSDDTGVSATTAARKSDDTGIPATTVAAPTAVVPSKNSRQLLPPPPQTKIKEEKLSRPQSSNDVLDKPKDMLLSPPAPARPQHRESQEDAHEWFLEHYADDDPSPAPSGIPGPPHSPSPSISPVISSLPAVSTAAEALVAAVAPSRSPSPPKKPTPSPAPDPDDLALEQELEQELEELVADAEAESSPAAVSKHEKPDIDMDLDVDLAVQELVEETMEEVEHKREEEQEPDVGMEVDDVEDELLSLVDDRRHPPPARRLGSAVPAAPVASSPTAPTAPKPEPHTPVAAAPSPSVPRPTSTRPTSDRGSMPPPASINIARNKEKDDHAKKAERSGSVSLAPPKKKKETVSKPVKGKAGAIDNKPVKPRGKPGPKPKKVTDAIVPPKTSKSAGSAKKNNVSTSRSRSASALPGGSAGPDGEAKEEEEEDSDAANEDDKLYCVCKTKYDEDRFMIACDRCDEWYHTQCVDLPDLEVDLVDQFICPPCIEKNPHLSLRTTYKKRCLYGLKHPDPSSPKACHKPARGAFSKYCSDECGVKFMQSRIDSWAKKGGKKDKLWESVKNAEKREGVVVCADPARNGVAKMEEDSCADVVPDIKPKKSKLDRETERLNDLLDHVVRMREEIKKGMEVVLWREKLLELASERAEQIGQCGWDQRLCFGDEEWADFGAGVLESYEDVKTEAAKEENGDMEVDEAGEGHGEWWCSGNASCGRHVGWQLTRYKDVCKEKEKKEEALLKLTTREREIRKRIEDILDPHGRESTDAPLPTPLKVVKDQLSNGHVKSKTIGDGLKKGKKRKAPGS